MSNHNDISLLERIYDLVRLTDIDSQDQDLFLEWLIELSSLNIADQKEFRRIYNIVTERPEGLKIIIKMLKKTKMLHTQKGSREYFELKKNLINTIQII